MNRKVALWDGGDQKVPSQTRVGTLDFPDNFKPSNAGQSALRMTVLWRRMTLGHSRLTGTALWCPMATNLRRCPTKIQAL